VSLEVAVWLAPLVLTVFLAVIGWSMINGGVQRIKKESLTPHKTIDTLKEDKRFVERKVKS
jgi:hypothetical protein